MQWLVDNWTFLVVIICILGLITYYAKKFTQLPSDAQLQKVKEWLLYAVIEAEKVYKGGTGVLKLRAVYHNFCLVFPSLVTVVSFEVFSKLVDEALEKMRHLLQTNESIKNFVEGNE